MLQNNLEVVQTPVSQPAPTRIVDLAAMLRLMHPLNPPSPDPITGRRRLLADLCRFIGMKVGTVPPESLGFPQVEPETESIHDKSKQALQSTKPASSVDELSPRQEQTLRHLLNGDSEKQVARKLQLSQHTVHVYVKALYRRFGVSTRAELLAKQLKK